MKAFYLLSTLFAGFLLAGCAASAPEKTTLTVMTHDSFNISEQVVEAFEQENGVQLVFLKSGDAGSALNRAVLSKKAPQADVLYGVDNTFLSRALSEDLFETYQSPNLEQVNPVFLENTSGLVTPIDYGDVCINYDISYFNTHKLAVPQSLADLLKPEYGKGTGREGLLVVENPATSSPGLAFLLATIAEFGEDGYLDYWRGLKANGTVVVNDWEVAYYTNFSGSSGKGLQPMVVSYATSPVAEVIYAAEPITEAPTASITGSNTCFRQVEYAGILKGTKNLTLARRFIDFMLDTTFQEDLPLQNFVYPVSSAAKIPDEFTRYAQVPLHPAVLDPALIAAKRDQWISDWTEVMLR